MKITGGEAMCNFLEQINKEEKPSAVSAGSTPSDTEMLDWLAQQCFYPGDCPLTGVYVVVSECHLPNGAFSGNPEKDAASLRAAIKKAM